MVNRIKELMTMTIEATKDKLNCRNRMNCFELFGYDFMISQQPDFHIWLIEANSNPCLEESSILL